MRRRAAHSGRAVGSDEHAPRACRQRAAAPLRAAVPLGAAGLRRARATSSSGSTRASSAPTTRSSPARSTTCAGTAACAATRGCRCTPPRAGRRATRPPDRDEIELPLRGRPLRDKIVLRLIAINRALHFVVLGAAGAADPDLQRQPRRALRDDVLQGRRPTSAAASRRGEGTREHGHRSTRSTSCSRLRSSNLHLFAAIALLSTRSSRASRPSGSGTSRRWAEYLTFIVTASLLPLEVYELVQHVDARSRSSPSSLNVAVVAYLLYAKRLFGCAAAPRPTRR